MVHIEPGLIPCKATIDYRQNDYKIPGDFLQNYSISRYPDYNAARHFHAWP